MTPSGNSDPETAPVVFTRQFDRRVWITLVVGLASLVVGVSLTFYAAWPTRIRLGYSPPQPIAFSHQLHAGVLGVDCRYCHTEAAKSAHATVPALSVCMNCHGMFTPDAKKKEQVARLAVLLRHWEARKPVVWNRVYDLADFVYFQHDRHLAAGLDCRNCHGDVETMPRVRQVAPLTMGWCLRCHMARAGVRLTDEAILAGKRGLEIANDPIYRRIAAPINCSTCHR